MSIDGEVTLSIQLFGTFEITCNGAVLSPPLSGREQRLLEALILLQYGQEIPRATLAETLWPDLDNDAEKARNNLRQSLRILRNALGEEASRNLLATRDSLRLDLSGVEVD